MTSTTRVFIAIVFATSLFAEEGSREGGSIGGDYRVVINHSCVRTPFVPPPANGFDPNTKQLLTEGEAVTALGTGLLRLEQDGSLQLLEGLQTEVSTSIIGAGKTPVTPPAEFACTGNYSVNGKKMTLTLACEVKTPDPTIKVVVGPQHFEGYIDRNGKTISLTNLAGAIQTISVSAFGNTVQQRQRICTQYALISK
jgi:hypothetical protein